MSVFGACCTRELLQGSPHSMAMTRAVARPREACESTRANTQRDPNHSEAARTDVTRTDVHFGSSRATEAHTAHYHLCRRLSVVVSRLRIFRFGRHGGGTARSAGASAEHARDDEPLRVTGSLLRRRRSSWTGAPWERCSSRVASRSGSTGSSSC